MGLIVSISSVILKGLYGLAVICLVMFILSFILHKRRKLNLAGESSEGSAVLTMGKLTKWSSKSWGNYAVGFYWWFLLAAFVFVFVAFAYAGITTYREAQVTHPTVTADNSPVNMFLQLDEDITLEQVWDQENDRDWYFRETAVGAGSNLTDLVGKEIQGVTIYPAWSEESGMQSDSSYLYYGESAGEMLNLYFAVEEDGSTWLVYARLVIKTDEGTATCYYYPTDITQWGYKTGFNLTVQISNHLLKDNYLLASSQEVVDIISDSITW